MRGVLLDPRTGRPTSDRAAAPRTYTPITDLDVFSDIAILAGEERRNWSRITGELSGVPTALLGGIAGLEVNPPPDALAAVTFTASEQALWTAATWTPISANNQGPKSYELYVAGTITTITSPGTMTLTPRFGTTTAGGTLGASNAVTLTASVTAVVWSMRGDVTVRGTGTGTNARVWGSFNFSGKLATAGNGAKDQDLLFGYTAATGDSSVAQGLFMGITGTVTTPTITVQQIRWGSWN